MIKTLNLPYSKSISNRLLIIHCLSKSQLCLSHLSESDDTRLLLNIINHIAKKTSNTFHTQNAGTTTRFLIALLSTLEGEWKIEADERMNFRPVIPLIEALKQLGADIEINSETKIFPIKIKGKKLRSEKIIQLNSTQSSQIVSAIAMIAPYCKGGLKIEYPTNQTSLSYIEMTLSMMKNYGIDVERQGNIINIKEGEYKIEEETFEADWSSASFFYALVAISKTHKLFIPQLKENSLQGDKIIAEIFEKSFGVITTYTQEGAIIEYNHEIKKQNQQIDFSNCPDLFLPVLIADVCTDSQISYKGLQTLSLKESDRLNNSIKQIEKLNIKSTIKENILSIDKTQIRHNNLPILIETHQDHRMAMAFSLLAFKYEGIRIENPECVSKSFPNYWNEVNKIKNNS